MRRAARGVVKRNAIRAPRFVVRAASDTYDPSHELTDEEVASMTPAQIDHYISTEPA